MTNQKSLDKKKTKELDNPIQVYKTDWRKMTPKRINGLVEKLNTPKLKELDKTIMEKLLEQFHCKGGKTINGEDVYLMTKSDIDNLLTQQRTELLDEINKGKEIKFKDIINSANMLLGINGFRLTFDGEMLGLIDERLIKKEIKKL